MYSIKANQDSFISFFVRVIGVVGRVKTQEVIDLDLINTVDTLPHEFLISKQGKRSIHEITIR